MNPETGEVIHCAKYWGKSPLHLAVLDDNPKHCEELISQGEDVNIVYCGMTPLHLACKVGHRDMVETLIRLKSDVNAGTMMEGCTPLHMSSTLGHQELTDVLLQNGADINKVTERGVTPLWLASQNGHTAAAHRLIQQGMDINKANNDGISPLAVAVCNGSTEVAEALVAANCKIDQADNSGCTPLYHAVKAGQRDISQLLVEAGATVNQSTNSGDYPIHLAALYGNITILDTLINWGADVTISTSRGTPLYCAVQRQHVNAARKLIQAGAVIDVEFRKTSSDTPCTPLIEAVCHRNPNLDLVCTLIQGGCNVDAVVTEKVPIEYALRYGHLDVCHLLLRADCNPFLSDVGPVLIGGKLQKSIEEYLRIMYNPKSLAASCRRTIRASLGFGCRYVEKINHLNLPCALKNYLSYAELSPDNQIQFKSKS